MVKNLWTQGLVGEEWTTHRLVGEELKTQGLIGSLRPVTKNNLKFETLNL